MPRRPEPSFRLKQIIWDLAATTGAENLTALLKDLDYKLEELRKNKNEDFSENLPDIRTVQRIIELDINRLLPEVVVSKLPPHVWHLRHDYEKIKELADSMKTEQEALKKAQDRIPIAERETTSNPRLFKHLDELAKTAESLAHQCKRLLCYKDNANVEAVGDICGHLFFWRKPNKTIVEEGADPTGEFTYESEHPIDPYLGKLLYIHYGDEFGRPPFKEWNRLSIANVSAEIVDNLKFLAHGGLKRCSECPICLQT